MRWQTWRWRGFRMLRFRTPLGGSQIGDQLRNLLVGPPIVGHHDDVGVASPEGFNRSLATSVAPCLRRDHVADHINKRIEVCNVASNWFDRVRCLFEYQIGKRID